MFNDLSFYNQLNFAILLPLSRYLKVLPLWGILFACNINQGFFFAESES